MTGDVLAFGKGFVIPAVGIANGGVKGVASDFFDIEFQSDQTVAVSGGNCVEDSVERTCLVEGLVQTVLSVSLTLAKGVVQGLGFINGIDGQGQLALAAFAADAGVIHGMADEVATRVIHHRCGIVVDVQNDGTFRVVVPFVVATGGGVDAELLRSAVAHGAQYRCCRNSEGLGLDFFSAALTSGVFVVALHKEAGAAVVDTDIGRVGQRCGTDIGSVLRQIPAASGGIFINSGCEFHTAITASHLVGNCGFGRNGIDSGGNSLSATFARMSVIVIIGRYIVSGSGAQVANGILCTGGEDLGSVFGSVPTAGGAVLSGIGGKGYSTCTATGCVSQIDGGRWLVVHAYCQSDGTVATSCIFRMNGEGASSVNSVQVVVVVRYLIVAQINMV